MLKKDDRGGGIPLKNLVDEPLLCYIGPSNLSPSLNDLGRLRKAKTQLLCQESSNLLREHRSTPNSFRPRLKDSGDDQATADAARVSDVHAQYSLSEDFVCSVKPGRLGQECVATEAFL